MKIRDMKKSSGLLNIPNEHRSMKTNERKHLRYAILFVILISLIFYKFTIETYTLLPDRKIGFPLRLYWKTKLNDNIRQIHITDKGNIISRLAYSANLISPVTGELIWKFRTEKPISTVTSNMGLVYVIGTDTFYELDEDDGNVVWENSSYHFLGSPAFSYANFAGLLTEDHGIVHLFDITNGNFIRQLNSERGRPGNGICINSDIIYIFYNQIDAYTFPDGKHLWTDDSYSSPANVICENEYAYFTNNDSQLVAYELTTKIQLWKSDFRSKNRYDMRGLFIANNFLVLDESDAKSIISKEDGKIVHSIPVGNEAITSVAVVEDKMYIYYDFSNSVYSYQTSNWQNSGILHNSPQFIVSGNTERFHNHGNMLILWENKYIYAYK